MPARDPAASPHLPTSLQPGSNAPLLPSHRSLHLNDSPSSSSFSIRSHYPNGGSDSPSPNLQDRAETERSGSGLMSQVLRRLSTSGAHIPPAMEAPGGNGIMQDESGSIFSNEEQEDRPQTVHAVGPSTSARAIRDSSTRLASLSFTPGHRHGSSGSGNTLESFSPLTSIRPQQQSPANPMASTISTASDHRPTQPSHLKSILSDDGEDDLSPPKSIVPGSVGQSGPSALTMMMEKKRPDGPSSSPSPSNLPDTSDEATPMPRKAVLAEEDESDAESSSFRNYLAGEVNTNDLETANESTPLLGSGGHKPGFGGKVKADVKWAQARIAKITPQDIVRECVQEPVKALPAVILGLLLNVLDGVSYGMILFPANIYFPDYGSIGVSMFFTSCIISQLTFSLGGSIFGGGNGSMMIEAVPFFHILVNIIQNECGDDPVAIVSTTMAAFAFSSILTGLVFMALGTFKLGALIGYFPRHILVGCIGGVGVFLIETGLEVSRGLKEEGFEYNLGTLKFFFESPHAIALWTIPLFLAILLRVITHFYHHQLFFPAYFFIIPVIFYIIVAIGGWDFQLLRDSGWVFDVGRATQPWWKFYTLYNFKRTNWLAFWSAMPTQLALVFFGILHVPLNVPALGVSLSEDNVKLDRELVAHGISNLAAGFTGTVPNYLCYVNTVLFYRVGGGTRLAGLMLAAATALIMFVGPTVIGYLPVMVVGALIFVLGLDLTIEAVWDTRNRVNRMEYITIWVITIGMTLFDFVIGLLLGIILACVFFVVQSSRRRAIRTVFSGATAKSTVRRPRSQRAFIQQVGSQTYVMKLQGFLFFGTISAVEEEIRKLLDRAKWDHNPIRFLIIDFALVHGLDFSSAEAFVRIQRLLAAKDVLLILCGAAEQGLVGTALRGVDLWADREGTRVEVFAALNDALEWTENAYLTAFYENQKRETDSGPKQIDFPKISKPPFSLAESFQNSPRRSHLAKAGDDTLPYNPMHSPTEPTSSLPGFVQPLPILLQTFQAYTSESQDFFFTLMPYFLKHTIMSGQTLWRQKENADGLYLIEVGCLRATYAYDDHIESVQETMVSGTVAGDLSMLSDTKRNATVVAERDCVLWKLDRESLGKLEEENPAVARRFIQIVLKAAAEEVDVLASHLIAVLS
ncbi:sulfate permease, SulP family, partial [Tremellales sp. Uapishka_1]